MSDPSQGAVAILVAAGKGERMGGGRPKAFLPLAGRPILAWAVQAFDACPEVSEIVVVAPRAELAVCRKMLEGWRKVRGVVPGGDRRQDSVRAGLAAVPGGFAGVVLVHDAARPLVDDDLIRAVIAAARRTGAAVPVVEVVDTIKSVQDGMVRGTVDRTELGAAQTPQGFRCDLLRWAYDAADRSGALLTDESMAVERLGEPVAAVPGSVRNRKITTSADLQWAEDQLRAALAAASKTRPL
jgi:2-C-methyl-D-erythritol 4-phosphate cytidylyltransferase